MPIKKDESGKRWVEMELLVPGTPEQVWQALATGPGNTGWFTRTEVDGRVGGVVRFDFGGGAVSVGEVTAWEPPRQLGYIERAWATVVPDTDGLLSNAQNAPPIATEITIQARSGDRCVVRMVHSLFTSADSWDDQVEGFEAGWRGLFEVLRVYLAHFLGQETASFWLMLPTKGDPLGSWQKLQAALGIAGADVGERRNVTLGAEVHTCVVEHVYQDAKQRYCLLRLEGKTPGMVLLGTYATSEATRVSLCRYCYGDDAEEQAARSEPALRDWLSKAFAT